jgi:predicted GNAT family acetyltransferase
MIRVYGNGEDFWNENGEMLLREPEKTGFFRGNAALLKKTDLNNYALRCEEDGHVLLALRLQPYSLLLYGESTLAEELAGFLCENSYDISAFMCEADLGDVFAEMLKKHSRECRVNMSMMFMECTEVCEPSSPEVGNAGAEDIGELTEDMNLFFADCGLPDRVTQESVANRLGNYRLIRLDGKIVSMASWSYMSEKIDRITCVYTRPEYRGGGIARKVVNTLKNEILARGKTAALNVDTANPVSSHLYASLGFKNSYLHRIYQVENGAETE